MRYLRVRILMRARIMFLSSIPTMMLLRRIVMAISATTKSVLLDALKLKEASVKRMQTSKPAYAEIFNKELADIAAARVLVSDLK